MVVAERLALASYQAEVSQILPISQEQSADLAYRIQKGQATATKLKADSGISPDQRVHLKRTVDNGLVARDALVEAHLKLVISVARRYTRPGFPPEDLIQEGNIGLTEAADGYIPIDATPFRVYALTVVKRRIFKFFRRELSTNIRRINAETVSLDLLIGNEAESLEDKPDLDEFTRVDDSLDLNQIITGAYLSKQQRATLKKTFVDGRSTTDVGEEEGRTHMSVNGLKKRAIARLQKSLRHVQNAAAERKQAEMEAVGKDQGYKERIMFWLEAEKRGRIQDREITQASPRVQKIYAILVLRLTGHTNYEIVNKLSIKPKTVGKYASFLLRHNFIPKLTTGGQTNSP